MDHRPGYIGPLLLIAAGSVLLLNNTGLIPGVIWGSLWHYWPVILILFGIQILAKQAGSDIIYWLCVILSILILAAVIFLTMHGYPEPERIGKYLKGADLNDTHLDGEDLNFADLDNANLSNSSMRGANMNFASMEYANLSSSNMQGANMNFASMEYADLSYSVLEGANMNFADFDGANMRGAIIEGSNHAFARTSESTICPDSKNGPCW